ncbi:MAG: GNAT family N-acetyltransferase [Actinobacteria bacterium]|nr:GNAT family N-acetyltransferase [Actinomycetota bacterium]
MSIQGIVSTYLMLDGWLEFNRVKWGLQVLKLRLSEEGKGIPAIEAVFYLDKRDRIYMPRLNPYLPIIFIPTPTESVPRLYRQWLGVSGLLAEEFISRGLASTVVLSPEITDIREWKWRGFQSDVRYTYFIDLPYSLEWADSSTRNKISKANKNGFICERALVSDDILSCLKDTEERKGFNYDLTLRDLQLAHELLGEEGFRIYACYAPNGEVASARIALHLPGVRALDWVAGTRIQYLQSGATQLLIAFMLDDLAAESATGLDFAGANNRVVAAAKANFGGRITPYYIISAPSVKSLAGHIKGIWQFQRGS